MQFKSLNVEFYPCASNHDVAGYDVMETLGVHGDILSNALVRSEEEYLLKKEYPDGCAQG